MRNRGPGFIRKEVSTLLEMEASTIQLYTDREIIIPDIANPKGRGTNRRYSKRNLVELLIIRELAKKGLTLANIKTVFSVIYPEIKEKWFNPSLPWLNETRVCLIIYDHEDSAKIEVDISWRNDPDKNDKIPYNENTIQEARVHRDKIELNMTNHYGAVIIDISRLWERIKDKI